MRRKVKANKKIMDKANEIVGSLRSTPEGSNEDNNLLNLIRKIIEVYLLEISNTCLIK